MRLLPALLALPAILHATPAPAQGAATAPLEDHDAQSAGPATMAEGHRLRDAGRLFEALGVFERVLARDPRDDGAWRMRALTLADLGHSQLAYEAVDERPEAFEPAERERLQDDRIARGIAWGALRPEDPHAPLAESRAALDGLRELQRTSPRTVPAEADRLRVDAISALNRQYRHQEAVDAYQALLDDGIQPPDYILPAVGESLLALRRPEQASDVLARAHAAAPDNGNVRILQGYAWLEQERFDLALPAFETWAASQAAWPYRPGAKAGYQNWDRYDADLNAALAHGYANDTARAEREMESLAGMGPYNAGLLAAAGTVQSMRGRPRAAQQRYDAALTIEPAQRDARIARAGNWLALAHPERAVRDHRALRAETPDDTRLDRLAKQIDRYRGWQFEAAAGRGRSEPRDGGTSASPLGSRDGDLSFRLESPLIDDRWRIGVAGSDAWADFDGARVRDRRLGAGVAYRHGRLGASAYATRALDDYDDGATGLDVALDWRFSDAWLGTVGYRLRDPDASLQARRFGITADSLTVGAAFAPSDTTRLDLRAGQYRYEDGNRRSFAGADFSQRVLSRPHLMVDGLASAATSRGSDGADAPYFNPSRDASLAIGARAEHIAWRRYDRAFRQRFQATAGPYWQEGYGTHWVPSLSYRHAWDLGVGSELEYGVSWSRPVYDGRREQRIGFDLAYRWGTAP